MSGNVDVFAWDPSKGSLTEVQRAQTVPHDFFGDNHSGEIEIHPSGKFLYESNRRTQSENVRGPETIGVFAIDPRERQLTPVQAIALPGESCRAISRLIRPANTCWRPTS